MTGPAKGGNPGRYWLNEAEFAAHQAIQAFRVKAKGITDNRNSPSIRS